MNKQNAPSRRMPAPFYILAAALALGFICTIVCFIGGGLFSPLVPLSQSPALLAVCIIMLSFYSDKPREKFFFAAFVLFAIYFAVVLAVSGTVAVLPLAASFVLSFCAKNGFANKRLSLASTIAALAASLASAVVIAVQNVPSIFASANAQENALENYLGRLFTGNLVQIGYTLFALVPVLFFTSALVYIAKTEK